jgi:hypothetical protein
MVALELRLLYIQLAVAAALAPWGNLLWMETQMVVMEALDWNFHNLRVLLVLRLDGLEAVAGGQPIMIITIMGLVGLVVEDREIIASLPTERQIQVEVVVALAG